MWVCLSGGFLSIVAHRRKPGVLLVRARREGDIERVFPDAKVSMTPDADYRFRAELPRKLVATVIADQVQCIDYPNFKDSVPDHDLHSAYSGFWSLMHRLQSRLAG